MAKKNIEDIKSEQAKRLRVALDALGIEQKELYRGGKYEVGSKAGVNRWFTGNSDPRDSNIEKLCEKLNLNIEWIKTGEGEMKKKVYKLSDYEEFGAMAQEPVVKMPLTMLIKMYYEEIELINKMLQSKQRFYGQEIEKLR